MEKKKEKKQKGSFNWKQFIDMAYSTTRYHQPWKDSWEWETTKNS